MSIGLSKSPAQARLVFLVVATAVFMTNLDLWIVNVALNSIGSNLPGSSLGGLSWVLNAYAVTLAALLIVAGRTGDRIGARRLFLIGIGIFTVASLGCAVAPNLDLLIVARVVQAVGAALQIPTSLALLLASVPSDRRHSATRLWSAVGALAAASGPVLGGLLVEASWRWVFVVNLPIGVAALVLGRVVLPHPPQRPQEARPDLVGSGLLTIAVATLTGAIVQGPSWGWESGRIIGLLALSVAGLSSFLWRCAHHPVPLFELAILRVRTFALATSATFLFSAAFAIMLLSNALWCQDVWHYSALRTGLAMAAGPAVVPFVAIGSNRWVRRLGPGVVSAAGCVIFGLGLLWRVAFAGSTPDYLGDLLPSMLLGGTGVGLALSTLIASASTAQPPERAGTGAALVNTSRQIASSVGVAVLVAILGSSSLQAAGVSGFDRAWIVAAALAAGAGVVSVFMAKSSTGTPTGTPTEPPTVTPTPAQVSG